MTKAKPKPKVAKEPEVRVAAPSTTEAEPVVWSGAKQLLPLLVPLDSLTLDEENARLHPERNLQAIERSLREFGQTKPVVVKDGIVYAGNGLVSAAMRVGWTSVAAVDVSHLTKAQARAYGLMDNKSGDLSEWDFQRVSDILKELPGELLDLTGFESFEREPLMQASWLPAATEEGHPETNYGVVVFRATDEQAMTIRRAIAKVKEEAGEGPEISEGRALELVCAEYLSGP